MSISLATLGMFQACCGGPGGGGAPPSYMGQQKFEKDEHMHVSFVYFEETKPLPEVVVKILGGVTIK
jgi:hypothetical protein